MCSVAGLVRQTPHKIPETRVSMFERSQWTCRPEFLLKLNTLYMYRIQKWPDGENKKHLLHYAMHVKLRTSVPKYGMIKQYVFEVCKIATLDVKGRIIVMQHHIHLN